MTSPFLDDMRALLQRECTRAQNQVIALTRQLDDIVSVSEEEPSDDEHDPEGHTLAFERQQLVALLADARERVAERDAAVARIDAGTYGACERCASPIARDRLVALPTARTCIGCAGLSSRNSGT